MGREQPKGWHREDIKAELRKRFGSLEALSRRWGYHKSAIGIALSGSRRFATLEQRIAKELKLSPHALWPDRWTPEGTPLSRAERNISRPRLDTHRSNARAA